jgi:uncharacterized membrane protein
MGKSKPPPPNRAFHAYDVRSAHARLGAAVLVGGLVAASLSHFSGAVRAVAGWNAFSIVTLIVDWWIISRSTAEETGRRAGAEDPGRALAGVIVLLSSAFSLFAATAVLRKAKQFAPEASDALVVLCLTAVVAAWFLTHSTYTLRYARLYYRDDDEGVGGLEFPGCDKNPDDMDFAYFAFTVGMCFQVSDVVVTSRTIRRAVLRHALISFAYNTTVVALALNLVFGLYG